MRIARLQAIGHENLLTSRAFRARMQTFSEQRRERGWTLHD